MAKALHAALATDEISFELERCELENGRLMLSGRWFGVRGRRFVRPTLTPVGGRELSRVLADLEHKPWAAEDGEPWEAAFPWGKDGSAGKFELSVAPDITIQLPAPGRKLALPRRFAALPRRPSTGPAWRPEPDHVEERPPPAVSDLERPPYAELEDVTAQLEMTRAELGAARAELEALRSDLADRADELEGARDELATAAADRDAAASQAASAITARDELTIEHDGLMAAHGQLTKALDQLTHERDQLTEDLAAAQRRVTALTSELEQARTAVDEAARQRDEAITAHGAALVMRRATRAVPHESQTRLWKAAVAIVALLAVLFAILIVTQVL
jgi:DNA repair exonuclease SbcCD ATPase subunit